MDALIKAKPSAAKGTYVKSVAVSATMGPELRYRRSWRFAGGGG